jgi:hypothetical protein
VCQSAYFFATGSLYFSILVTFSLGIPLVYALQNLQSRRDLSSGLLLLAAVGAVWLLNQVLTIDYGFWGIMTPVFAAFSQGKGKTGSKLPVLMTAVGLVLLGADLGGIQHYALMAIPLLLLYNGQRGKANLKYFFYIFYPVHLAVLQGIAWLVR